jgi:hypothetical protein
MRILLVKEYSAEPGALISDVLSRNPFIEFHEILSHEITDFSVEFEQFDAVLSFGPHYGRMMPLLRRVSRRRDDRSPRFIWWLDENPIAWGLPRLVSSICSRVRLLADDVLAHQRFAPSSFFPETRWYLTGHRFRIYGELMWAHRHGLPDVLAVTSARRVGWLRALGIEGIFVPTAYGPSHGRDLGLARDIPVAWVGFTRHSRERRDRLLARLAEDLSRRGIAVHRFDKLWDQERTEVLNRTKILLNLLRHPRDFTGHRLLLGAANKALVVSEPMDEEPLRPGRHMIQAPVDALADRVIYYLEHEDERRQITEAAYELVTT